MVKAAILVMLKPSAPARELIAWRHAPSQPLMRSLLSQFQTPTGPRRISRFFRVWELFGLPRRADHSAYFGLANSHLPTLSAVDGSNSKQSIEVCQRSFVMEFRFLWMHCGKSAVGRGKQGPNFRKLSRQGPFSATTFS